MKSAAPHWTGPSIFGFRPSSPVLIRLGIRGERPYQIRAEGLPSGLHLNPHNGCITGRMTSPMPANFSVRIEVKNESGECQHEIKLMAGENICATPPMGWNSWYCLSESVSEKAMDQTARALVTSGLADYGWNYVNLDDCWQGKRGGVFEAIQPNQRFPDLGGLCSRIHALGLKAGIYSTPWIATYAGFLGGSQPTEDWDVEKVALPASARIQETQFFGRHPSAQESGWHRTGDCWLFDRDARQWAEWGFDFVKVDWLPTDPPTTRRMLEDLRRQPRDLVMSLSNNSPIDFAAELSELAETWRTTQDIQDNWESILDVAGKQFAWQPWKSPGHWPDSDMLQIGNLGVPNQINTCFKPTRLTPDEQRSHLSWWCLFQSPLLLSCDVENLDEFTFELLTNEEVLAVNQDPAAFPAQSRSTAGKPPLEILLRPAGQGGWFLGLFNLESSEREMEATWKVLGLPRPQHLRDLWNRMNLKPFGEGVRVKVPSHGCSLFHLRSDAPTQRVAMPTRRADLAK